MSSENQPWFGLCLIINDTGLPYESMYISLGIEMLLTMHKEKHCLFLSSELCDHDPLNVNIHVGQGHYNITVKWWKSCQNKVNMKPIRALFPAALWFHDMPFLHEYWNDLYPSDTFKGWWIASLEVLPQQLKSFVFAVQFFIFFKICFDTTLKSKSEL